ncbi:type IV pilus modification protein PilV [Psychrobacter urativorans]|uniref:Type IV pilin Tt1218-like domain-containing protein n=1 Tax=Psychrobacter urativorans TaxID=45610 RepID=A0A0M4U772_9GAMM|nr:type IV pilus modification protein PilV [Psychrobacter urativorans]ALF59951.1 hypothetical protein AOC03_07780 [Psychrobacter urativorans]
MIRLSYQRGVGLVEVLVAVLLLSVAVLGFSALQLQAIKATDESLVRTQALSVVRGLAENMRANPLKMQAYQDAIKTPDESKAATCKELSEKCSSEQIAIKDANIAVKKLQDYGITISMVTCPGTANFSEIKCLIAAWGNTKPEMSDDANACATSTGVYKSGGTCVIVETY